MNRTGQSQSAGERLVKTGSNDVHRDKPVCVAFKPRQDAGTEEGRLARARGSEDHEELAPPRLLHALEKSHRGVDLGSAAEEDCSIDFFEGRPAAVRSTLRVVDRRPAKAGTRNVQEKAFKAIGGEHHRRLAVGKSDRGALGVLDGEEIAPLALRDLNLASRFRQPGEVDGLLHPHGGLVLPVALLGSFPVLREQDQEFPSAGEVAPEGLLPLHAVDHPHLTVDVEEDLPA